MIKPEMLEVSGPYGDIIKQAFCDTINNNPKLLEELEMRLDHALFNYLSLYLYGQTFTL